MEDYRTPRPAEWGQPQFDPRQTIIVENRQRSNGLGTAGFILSIAAILIGFIPVIGWVAGLICWALGALFSFIGLFRAPRGLAIAGFIISFIGVIIAVCFLGVLGIVATL